MTSIFDLLFGEGRREEEKLNETSYGVVEVDFVQAKNQGSDILLQIEGTFFSKLEYTGDKGDATIKINHRHATELPLSKIKSFKSIGGFDKIYLSSSDTHGKLTILASTGVISEIKPTIDNEVTESRRATKTEVLVVDSTNEESILTCPTGKRLEVVGFNAVITQKAPTGVSSAILCYTLDEDAEYRTLFRYIPIAGAGDDSVHTLNMTGLVFRGGLNRSIALNHMIFTGGAINASVTLYYRAV